MPSGEPAPAPAAADTHQKQQPAAAAAALPRAQVFQSPRYVQQVGGLAAIGQHVAQALPHVARPALVTSPRLRARYFGRLAASLADPVVVEFSGECSRRNVASLLARLEGSGADHVIGFGAGKLMDAVKMAAHALRLPMVIVPSLASTDAPCLAASIVYTDEGEYEACDFLPRSPDLVIVDPQVVAEAPPQYLAAGMGDAMATFYEAAACLDNPEAFTWLAPLSHRPPLIAAAIGRACLDTLFTHGVAALAECAAGTVGPALEAVVEANTLMSGLGAESGGLAVAHGFHNALTGLPETHGKMHGEKVAFGSMVHLIAAGRADEAERVARFNAAVGLPVCAADLGVAAPLTAGQLDTLVAKTLEPGSISWNLGRHLTPQLVRDAIVAADSLGQRVKQAAG